MKKIYFSSFVVLMLLSKFSFALEQNKENMNYACPDFSFNEQTWDCPWAAIARELQNDQDKTISLNDLAPDFVAKIKLDANSTKEIFWGTSLNFDDNAKAEIIDKSILKDIGKYLNTSISVDELTTFNKYVVKAGFEHTYGYLFSTLQTPYGYKRQRWLSGEIERAFKLPQYTFGPMPTDNSTLFSNVTYFAGKIAFRFSPINLKQLEMSKENVSESVLSFPYAQLKIERVVETIMAPMRNGQMRQVQLITDYVPFLIKNSEIPNAVLLIYTVVDNANNEMKLISMFPISQQSLTSALNKNNFGQNKSMTTRNNAYVEGVTGEVFKGERRRVTENGAE